MSTDIIIVSYQDEQELAQCVASIKQHCTDYNLIIETNTPENNRGFTKAVNDGIRKGKSEFIWLLNSDAIVKDSVTQQALIERFSYSSKIGVVGSMQIDPDNHDMIRCAGVDVCFPAGRHKGGLISMGHGQIPEKQRWQNFASVMIRRNILRTVGYPDEGMFLIYSDSSFCYSVREAGLECWYEPRSQIYHRLKASKNISEWHQKDMVAFMKK
jgi:GT2 family glycosyltransferase